MRSRVSTNHSIAFGVGAITTALVLALLLILAGIIFLRRNEQQLEEKAERALPGPIEG